MIRQSLVQYGAPLEETRIALPKPRGSEVLLRVRACGVCHSDLHLQDGHLDLGEGKRLDMSAGRTLPFTLGHEISGFAEAAGPDAGTMDPTIPYAVYAWSGCGACELCTSGREQLCETPKQLGIHADGGFASHVLVPHPRYLIDVSGIDELSSGCLMCSGLTAYSAVKKALSYLGSRPLLIVGLGGVGLMALSITRVLARVPIVAADIAEEKRTAAKSNGAASVFDPRDPSARKTIRDQHGACGAALDFVGSGETLAFAQGALGKGGAVVAVGLFGGRFSLPAPLFPLRELTILGSYVGSLAEAHELMQLARQGRIAPIPIRAEPLSNANRALQDLRAGRILGRVALRP
jgi:D-arabinose 1-dehydrogenase-like Zn-dependent alcohol dehydrogenase